MCSGSLQFVLVLRARSLRSASALCPLASVALRPSPSFSGTLFSRGSFCFLVLVAPLSGYVGFSAGPYCTFLVILCLSRFLRSDLLPACWQHVGFASGHPGPGAAPGCPAGLGHGGPEVGVVVVLGGGSPGS